MSWKRNILLIAIVAGIIPCCQGKHCGCAREAVPKAKVAEQKAKYTIPQGPLPSKTPGPFYVVRYFELMFREQDLQWVEMEKRKEIESKYQGMAKDAAKMKEKDQEIKQLQLDTGKKRKALFAEFGVTPQQLAATAADPEA